MRGMREDSRDSIAALQNDSGDDKDGCGDDISGETRRD